MIPCGIRSVLKSGPITSTKKNLLKHQFDSIILCEKLWSLHFLVLNPKITIKPENDIEMLVNKDVVKKVRIYILQTSIVLNKFVVINDEIIFW